jgi:hypothetical protein
VLGPDGVEMSPPSRHTSRTTSAPLVLGMVAVRELKGVVESLAPCRAG